MRKFYQSFTEAGLALGRSGPPLYSFGDLCSLYRMKSTKMFLDIVASFALLAVAASPAVQAAEVHGIKMADRVKVEGKMLELNGTGLRQATVFSINVYAAALYLTAASRSAEEILKTDAPKSLEMVFMRDVDAKDVAKAWAEGFDKNCEVGCEALKAPLGKLKGLVTSDLKKGDVMVLNFLSDRVELFLRGTKAGVVESKDFPRELLRLWLGKNPPNASLKSGLLGQKG